jgi:hypothetical protein
MLGTNDIDKIIEPRVNRNKVIGFTPLQAPKAKPGQTNFRSETAAQREIREMKNKLGMLVSTMVDYFHFVPRVDDPLTDVWSRVLVTTGWVITPENHLYQQINTAPNRDNALGHIRAHDLRMTKRILSSIVLLNLKIPENSNRGRELSEIILNLPGNNTIVNFPNIANPQTAIRNLTNVSLETLEDVSGLVEADIEEISAFRGKITIDTRKDQKDDKEVIKNLKETAPKVAKELQRITDTKLRSEIADWIKGTFRNKKLQLLAAQRAITAVGDKDLGYEEIEYDSDNSDDSDSD